MSPEIFTQFPIVTTERLSLRQLSMDDQLQVFALRSHPEINKYLDRKPAESIDDAVKFIQAIKENIQRKESVYWAITRKGSEQLIGTICLYDFSEDKTKAAIGFELLPEYQRQGIMQEVIAKVIEFGFEEIGLTTIEAYTHAENEASLRLLQKLNFNNCGTGKDDLVLSELTRGLKAHS